MTPRPSRPTLATQPDPRHERGERRRDHDGPPGRADHRVRRQPCRDMSGRLERTLRMSGADAALTGLLVFGGPGPEVALAPVAVGVRGLIGLLVASGLMH